MSYLIDPWKELRQEVCFCNVEPSVILTAITSPLASELTVEELPAVSARISYGKDINDFKDREYYINLNKQLIKMKHHVPLESIQYNFFASGLSKICSAQASRSRIATGHVSLSRRYTQQRHQFVYPLLNYIDSKDEAENIYRVMSMSVKDSLDVYEQIMSKVIGVKKSDARYVIPANTATSRHWWFNARSLRNFLELRLPADAEWEIRRLSFMLLDIVMKATPSLFEDVAEKFIEN